MVQRINFLIKETSGLSYKNYLQIIVGLLIIFVVVFILQKQLHRYYQRQQAFMQSEIERIQKAQESLLKAKPKTASLSAQEYVANQLRIAAIWSDFLVKLTSAIPDGLWLTNISASMGMGDEKNKTGGIVALSGQCFKAEMLPKFIGNLKEINLVQTITSPSLGKVLDKNSTNMSFKFNVILKTP